MLEARDRVADPWRSRHPALRLNIHRKYAGLPGQVAPKKDGTYLKRDTVVAHLERYARRIGKPRGKIVINVRFDTYEEQGLKAVIEEHRASGRWSLEEETVPIRPHLLAEPDLKTKLMVFSIP